MTPVMSTGQDRPSQAWPRAAGLRPHQFADVPMTCHRSATRLRSRANSGRALHAAPPRARTRRGLPRSHHGASSKPETGSPPRQPFLAVAVVAVRAVRAYPRHRTTAEVAFFDARLTSFDDRLLRVDAIPRALPTTALSRSPAPPLRPQREGGALPTRRRVGHPIGHLLRPSWPIAPSHARQHEFMTCDNVT